MNKAKKKFFTQKRVVIIVISVVSAPFILFWLAWSVYVYKVNKADDKLIDAAKQYVNVPAGWQYSSSNICGVDGCGKGVINYAESVYSVSRELDSEERRRAINEFSKLNGNFKFKEEEMACGESKKVYSNGCFRILKNESHQATIDISGFSGKTFVTVRIEKDSE